MSPRLSNYVPRAIEKRSYYTSVYISYLPLQRYVGFERIHVLVVPIPVSSEFHILVPYRGKAKGEVRRYFVFRIME